MRQRIPVRRRLPRGGASGGLRWHVPRLGRRLARQRWRGDLPAERAQETGVTERRLREQADQFEAEGIISLFRPTCKQVEDHHRSLPPPMRQAIVELKADLAGDGELSP